jgi:diadenosine tetraphosphate (Ap4A) HIT family hydrolase
MYRSRKSTLKYNPDKTRESLQKLDKLCPFCSLPSEQIVKRYKDFLVVKNLYGYQFWEFMDVTEHLMIIPKRHIQSIVELSKTEKQELIDIMGEWEDSGYNVYLREKESAMKSVPHQHSHLIKTKNKVAKFALYIRRPYLVVKK